MTHYSSIVQQPKKSCCKNNITKKLLKSKENTYFQDHRMQRYCKQMRRSCNVKEIYTSRTIDHKKTPQIKEKVLKSKNYTYFQDQFTTIDYTVLGQDKSKSPEESNIPERTGKDTSCLPQEDKQTTHRRHMIVSASNITASY